ncbi:recombination regulator RecX [Candidatus Kapaibacterium sp.]
MSDNIYIEKIIKSRIEGRCVLILSDNSSIYSLIETILRLGLNKGTVINPEHQEIITDELQIQKLKSAAFRLSEGFARSEYQIISKLKQKGFDYHKILEVIKHLKNLNLINDEKFAYNFINLSLKKKFGINRIKIELNRRKVKPNDYLHLIEDFFDEETEMNTCLEQATKKLRLLNKKNPIQKKDSLFRFLINKGFEIQTIKSVIEQLKPSF